MRRLIIPALLVFLPVVAHASCVPLTSAEKFARADVVLTGSPYSVLEGEQGQPTEVVFEPLTVYKGEAGDVVSIVQPATPTSVDADLSVDEPYLLFLKRGTEPDTFVTTQCDGTRVLGVGLTDEDKTALGAGTVIATLDEVIPSDLGPGDGNDATTVGVDEDLPTGGAQSWFKVNAWWFGPTLVAFALWSLVWKGLALWRAARRRDVPWFVLLLVVHTAGLVEIGYLIATRTRPQPAAPTPNI